MVYFHLKIETLVPADFFYLFKSGNALINILEYYIYIHIYIYIYIYIYLYMYIIYLYMYRER